MAKQMIAPANLTGGKVLEACEVPSGAFIIFPESNTRHVFFVSWNGAVQGLFPVQEDGTVDPTGHILDLPDTDNVMHVYAQVEAFVASQIPGLKTENNKIVWSKEKLDEREPCPSQQ